MIIKGKRVLATVGALGLILAGAGQALAQGHGGGGGGGGGGGTVVAAGMPAALLPMLRAALITRAERTIPARTTLG